MTEVPEHLLQRSRDRRKALGLPPAPGDTGAATPDVAPEVSANTPAVIGESAPAAAPKAPVPIPDTGTPPPPAEPPTAPWVDAANERRKIPAWVMPVLLFLPIWAFMYVGTLEDPTRNEGLIYEGGEVYAEHCAVCHGAGGGGGAGPAFTNGAVIETFSSLEEQIEWVIKGTDGFVAEGRQTYGDNAKPVGGGGNMPGFAGKLDAEHITLAVLYERIELGGYDEELLLGEALFDAFDHGEIAWEEAEITNTADDVRGAFAEIRAGLAGEETAAE